jgi:PAS domain S-box-containing protein
MSAEPQPTAGAASSTAREAAQRESGAFQRALLECADYAIISTTPDGVIRTFNRAAEQMLGYRAEEVVGQVTPEIIHDYDEVARRAAELAVELARPVPAGFEAFVAKARLGLADEQEWTYIRKDGSRFPVQLSVTAMRDEARQIIGFMGIAHDISRRREAQARVGQLVAQLDRRVRERTAQVAASEERFRLVVEASPSGLLMVDHGGRIVLVNAQTERLFGYAREELLGQPVELLLPEHVRAAHAGHRAKFISAPTVRAMGVGRDLFARRKDGGEFPVEIGLSPIQTEDGPSVLATVVDISERKAVEARLRASEERLKLAQHAARVGSFEWNIQTGINTWSPELEALYGLPPGGFPGTQPAWERLVHPDDLARAKALVQRAFDTNESVEGEWRVVWPDGSTHWLVGRFQVLRDAAGKPLRLTGVNLDITDRKRNEQALRQARDELETRVQERTAELVRLNLRLHSEIEDRKAAQAELQNREDQLRDLFENATDLIQSVAPDGRILFVNRAWLNTLGYRMSELAALTVFDIIHPDCLGECQEHFARVMRGEALNNFQAIFRTKDGRKIHVEGNASARFENGRPVATRGIFRDISKRKAVEEEREKLIAELQAALAEVKTLSGLLPVCGWCKKIRDDSGYWNSVEGYLKKSSGMDITHGICPDCQAKMVAELDKLTAESETPPPPSS